VIPNNMKYYFGPKFENDLNFFIVKLFIISVFFIRFFTETVVILPRALQFLDMGLLVLILIIFLLWFLAGKELRTSGFSGGLFLIYLLLLFLSVIFNIGRMELRVIGSYVLLQLGPMLFFIFFINANFNIEKINKLIKILIYTGIIQIVVSLFQIPKALAVSADFINGTFGWNSTQMLAFLSTFVFCLIASYRMVKQRKLKRYILILLAVSFFIFYLASWRALWLSFPATMLIVLYFEKNTSQKLGRILLFASIFLFALNFFFSFTGAKGNTYRYENNTMFQILEFDYDIKDIGKIRALLSVTDLYQDYPLAIIWGTGPGTYGSRAFRTFAVQYGGKTDVTADFVKAGYSSDVAKKYLYSIYDNFKPAFSSSTINSWQSSYVGMLGETGIFGFLLVAAIYVSTIKRLYRIHKYSFDLYSHALSLGSIGAILFLAQTSFFDDYLGVFRVTFPTWLLIGITFRFWELNKVKK